MSRLLNRLCRDERGIALMVALAATLTLAIALTSVITYTASNQKATNLGMAEQTAQQVAEAGLNQAYSILETAASTSSLLTASPATASAGLLHCLSTPTSMTSGCTTPLCVSVLTTGTCTVGAAGNASITGFFSTKAVSAVPGTTYAGVLDPIQNNLTGIWYVQSTGYAHNPNGALASKTMTAQLGVKFDRDNPKNAAVWNHLFATAPASPTDPCEFDVTQPSVYIDVPVYVTGDACLEGYNDHIWENPWNTGVTRPQSVDLFVGGKLVLSHLSPFDWCFAGWWWGGPSSVGECPMAPILSATVVGGCSTTRTGATQPCGGANANTYNFWVKGPSTAGTMVPPNPDPTAYAIADPGPKHPCAGLTFDNNTTADGGLNTPTTPFNLTPLTSYTCVSSNGGSPPATPTCQTPGPGQLSWNAATDQLTVSGTVYIDGSAQISQDAVYVGCGSLYLGGEFIMDCPMNGTTGQGSGLNTGTCTQSRNGWGGNWWGGYNGSCPGFGGAYNGNGFNGFTWGWSQWGWGCSSLCAVRTCDFKTWDPNTTNLAIVALAQNVPGSPKIGIDMRDRGDIFQGSLFTQPDSTISFTGDGMTIQGPEVGGKFYFGSNVTVRPLPPIDPKNMPPTAPLDPNTSLALQSPRFVTGG